MEVILAGFNVDKEGINAARQILEIENLSSEDRKTALSILKNLTPETIAASYARISRDARPIPELRADSRKDVEGSRKSNKAIIFTMGHKSIAEHAFFNFDIMGLSRRAVEALEEKRLQSYTEKSQRYITMDGDFVIPSEIKGTDLESDFLRLAEKQVEFYKRNLGKITDWHHNQDYSNLFNSLKIKPGDVERQKGTREGLGKEDARYSLGLSTQAQIGYSASARNIETLITKLRSSDNAEERELGEKIFQEIDGIAPSVIKYINPVDYFSKTRKELKEYVEKFLDRHGIVGDSSFSRVNLFRGLNRDDSIPAGIIFSSSDLSFEQCLEIACNMKDKEKIELLNLADKYQEVHDPKLREYELGDRITEMGMSSSAFAQMKRHRMNTLIPQRYLPELRITIPSSVMAVGLENDLEHIARESAELYYSMLSNGLPESVADYALINASGRRVLFDANNRQVYAFCAERENLPAQWDIRETANKLHSEMQKESPITLRALCGKDKFYETKAKTVQD